MENKMFKFYEKDGYYCFEIDTNKDGEPVIKIELSAKEGLDESMEAVGNLIKGLFNKDKKEEPKES